MASASGRPDASYLRMPAAALRAALDASRASRLSVSERCCSSNCCACQVKANHNRHAIHLHLQLHLRSNYQASQAPTLSASSLPPSFQPPACILPAPLHCISPSSAPARASVRARVAVAVAAGRRPARTRRVAAPRPTLPRRPRRARGRAQAGARLQSAAARAASHRATCSRVRAALRPRYRKQLTTTDAAAAAAAAAAACGTNVAIAAAAREAVLPRLVRAAAAGDALLG